MEIRLQSFQNGGPGPPKWSSWASTMESGAAKMGPGASKLEAKWCRRGQNRGLEDPGNTKTGSWTAWMAVRRAQGPSRRPSWGPRRRFGRPFGVTWRGLGVVFGGILGSQTSPERYFLGFELEMRNIVKLLILLWFFVRFGRFGSSRNGQN